MRYLVLFLIIFLIQSCSSSETTPSSHRINLLILPLNNPSEEVLKESRTALTTHFNFTITQAENIPLPENARSVFSRDRYRADTLLRMMHEEYSRRYNYILAITNVDITFSKKDPKDYSKIKSPEWKYRDWGIFGLGSCPGQTCIVSTFRLAKKAPEKLFQRLRKVVIHETGHMLGLGHCPDKKCVMTDAVESISTVDGAEEKFCINCCQKITCKAR